MTRAERIRAQARIRQARFRARHAVHGPRAPARGRALTLEQVHAIREARARGVKLAALAMEHATTEKTISEVARRLTWKHVP